MSKISIIMPVYNVEKYLANSVESVLNQTFKDFELICVNDGSSDNSPSILEKYAKQDNRIKVITQGNKGLSSARNTGLSAAKGEYIFFLDSDDQIHYQMLEICVHLMIKENADMVSFGRIETDGSPQKQNHIDYETIRFSTVEHPLYSGCCISKGGTGFSACTKMYRKSLLKDIHFIEHIYAEDVPFTYAVLAKRPKTVLLTIPLLYYTQNFSSLSHAKMTPKHLQSYRKGLESIIEIYSHPDMNKEKSFLVRDFIPEITKQQLNICRRSDESVKKAMFQEFAHTLLMLQKADLLHWRGHKLRRYLTYIRLLKGVQ